MTLTVATWNVNGIRAREAQVLEWIAAERPDVVCLQETKAAPDQVPAALRELPGYEGCWHGAGGYSGVALLVRQALASSGAAFEHPPFDFERRAVTAVVGGVTLASVYVPNGGKDFEAKMRFLDALEAWAGDHAAGGRHLVICGDLNVARADIDVHPKERKPRAIGQLPEERERFARLLARGLVDVGRALDPDNDRLFTWWAPWRNLRQRNIGWRIDYVLASETLAAGATSCGVRSTVGTSDHAPVVAAFAID